MRNKLKRWLQARYSNPLDDKEREAYHRKIDELVSKLLWEEFTCARQRKRMVELEDIIDRLVDKYETKKGKMP